MNRHEAFTQIMAGIDLTALGITNKSVQLRRAGSITSPEMRPFIDYKWGSTTPYLKLMASETLEVWVYDEQSYAQIGKILVAIRDAVLSSPETMGDVQWNGFSEDLYDDIFKCVTRYVVFTVPTGGN